MRSTNCKIASWVGREEGMDLGGVAMTMRKMRSMTVSKNRYKIKK